MDQQHGSGSGFRNITASTGISIGIVVTLLGGFALVMNGISSTKTEIINTNAQMAAMKSELSMQALSTKNDLTSDIKELKVRMTNLEAARNTWGFGDMFKWAVHLQQLNKDPKKLQTEGLTVPEPEVNNGK